MKTLAHGPIEQIDTNLWRCEGALPRGPLKRVMTIAKMDGGLVLHSAIALDDAELESLEKIGPIRIIVVPNAYHRLDANQYAERYPNAKIFAPRGARAAVEKIVKVSGTLDEFPNGDSVSFTALGGVGDRECAMLVRSETRTSLVFNDILFNAPHANGFGGFILKHIARSSGGPRITPIAKMFLVKDKSELRKSLEKLAETPDLSRIIVSHSEMITTDPARVLKDVASLL